VVAKLPGRPSRRRGATQAKAPPLVAVDDVRLGQHQFVHALIRVSWVRYKEHVEPSTALASCFGRLTRECLEGLAERVSAAQEEVRELCKSRGVRAALLHHRKELKATYVLYARIDKLEVGGHAATMSLAELMSLLKETGLLDLKLNPRVIAEAFVHVNMEDELYVNANKDDISSELVYDEFCELIVRIAREKLPVDELEVEFGVALDTWLGLDFMPRARAARQRRLGGASGIISSMGK